MLGIIKDYLAIARGTFAVTVSAALAGSRSAASALMAMRPNNVAELRDRPKCGSPTDTETVGRETSAAQVAIAATVQGEVERMLGSLELVSRAELDSLRLRLSDLERQVARQLRVGGPGAFEESNR